MAGQLNIYEIEYEGQVYEIEAPDGTPEEELFSAVQGYKPPAPTKAAPTVAAPVSAPAAPAPQREVLPNAVQDASRETVLPTKAMEEVPGAREYLEDQFWNGKSYNEVSGEFAQRFPGVRLTDDAPQQWAENLAFARTPEGRNYFRNNSPFAPVNRATGVEDPDAPDSFLEEAFVSGQRSLANMANTVTGAAGLVSDLVGADETAEDLLDTYLERSAAIQQEYPTSAGMAKDIGSVDDAVMWGGSVLGELVPQLTASLGGGLVGGAVARKAVERGVADFVEDQVTNGVTREAAEELAAKAIQRKIATGQIAGAGVVSEVQSTGSIYGDTYGQTGERKPWTALLAGTAAASLDTILPARVMKKLGVSADALNTAATSSLIKRLGKEGASSFLIEGGTEALQTVIEQLPAGKGVNWDQVVEAALRGGFGGGLVGVSTEGYQSAKNRALNPPVAVAAPVIDAPSVVAPTAKGTRTKAYKAELATAQQQTIDRINTLTQSWQNAPSFEVHQNFSQIKGLDRGAIGAIHDGKVVINTQNVVKEAARRNVTPDTIVNSVVFHEGLGHHGLNQLFGDMLDTKLSEILSASPVYQQRVEKWMKKNPDAYKGVPNRDLLALEEILAERSEAGQLPASIVNQFKNTIKNFGRRMGLEMEYSTREVETILGMAHSAVVNGKGRGGAASNGFKYMYLGAGADTADVGALRMAELAERQGRDVGPEGVTRSQTGWFKGPDDMWRFEIPDNTAGVHSLDYQDAQWIEDNSGDEWNSVGGQYWVATNGLSALRSDSFPRNSLPLDKVMDHPELFEAYPELREVTVVSKWAENEEPGIKKNYGSFHPRSRTIYINSELNDTRALSTLLHEVQHAVQTIEGFAKGGNMDSAVLAMPEDHVVSTAKNYRKWQKGRIAEKKKEVAAYIFAAKDPDANAMAYYDEKVKGHEEYLAGPPVYDDELEQWVREGEQQGLDKSSREQFEAEKRFLKKLGTSRGELTEQQEAELDEVYEFLQTYPDNEARSSYIKSLQKTIIAGEIVMSRLDDALAKNDIPFVQRVLVSDSNTSFQAYQSLFGEVEARDVQERQWMGRGNREDIPPYTTEGLVDPSAYVIDMQDDSGAMSSTPEQLLNSLGMPVRPTYSSGSLKPVVDDRLIRDDQMLRRQAQRNRVEQDRMAALDRGVDPESIGLPKYMMMTSPDKVEFTPEEIADMDPEDIVEAQNAFDLLERMTEGYTPVVMTMDDLREEADMRGVSLSKVMNTKSISPGEITRRMFMYDIAMQKTNDQLSALNTKMNNGTFTQSDKATFLKTAFKQKELAARIWDEQGEIARALASMKKIEYTRRRVEGTMQTLAQFSKGSEYEYLNDDAAFYRFAMDIQGQIDAAKAKVKDKGKDWVGNAINLPRSLMSSMDLSAPLRQGLFLIHKKSWWTSFFNMFRYAGDQKAFNDLQESIINRPTYREMLRANLALSNTGDKLSQREEDFMSTWAEKIPGIGKLVQASERAYVGFLNKLRADVFDQLYNKLPEGYTDQDLKDLGRFVNAASGRGNLPKAMQGAAPMLNGLFFSPRLIASRVVMTTALVDPRTYTTMNKVARNEYIKSILTVGGLALMITTLAAVAGAEVEEDPRSSDFAKIKVGNTRFDILGGEGQYITLAARIAKNSYKTTDGQIKPYGTKFGQTTRLDAVGRFFTNKAAPIPSFVLDYLRGTDPVGKKFETDEAVVSRFIPMLWQDIYENAQELGYTKAGLLATPGMFGVGVQTYTSQSLDTERELEAPDDFELKTAADGEYPNAVAEDGTVRLDDEAKKEWAYILNTYYKEWLKDEMDKPEWKTYTEDERRDIIAEVRRDARKEAKLDMIEILGIEEVE